MKEIIKPHSFEDAKHHIQTFSNRTSPDLGLEKVSNSGGLFGLFDHNVTGAELNRITSQVQEYLIKFNELHTDFIKEFGQVYRALESLDGEYIPAILSAVKGAEIASNQAKAAQDDIKKTIEAQKKIIKVLEEHKAKLDKLKHLTNIDQIWNDSKILKQDIKAFKSDFEGVRTQVTRLEESIKSVQRYAASLLDYEHLDEIDDIWERVGQNETEILKCNNSLDGLKSIIDVMQEYKHLADVDIIWGDVEKAKTDLTELRKKTEISSTEICQLKSKSEGFINFKKIVEEQVHWQEIDIIWDDIQNGKNYIEQIINAIDNIQNEINKLMERLRTVEDIISKLNSQNHIFQIDKLWNNNDQVTIEVSELTKKIDETNAALQVLTEKTAEEEKAHQITVNNLKQRIKIAYYVAGGTICLGVIELILNVLGII